MASDVHIVIFDPQIGAVACNRWIGQRDTIEKAIEVLEREPDHAEPGFECWADVRLNEMLEIATSHYWEGADPEEIQKLNDEFPPKSTWWMLLHDY